MVKCLCDTGLVKLKKKWKLLHLDKTAYYCPCTPQSAFDLSVRDGNLCTKCGKELTPKLERVYYYQCPICKKERR